MHGLADGTCVAWQPPAAGSDGSEEEALYRVVMDDGDEEDLNEDELKEALEAHSKERTVAEEAESDREGAWLALEMAIHLYEKVGAAADVGGLAQARERLGDVALQNEQPERALEEYTEARRRLVSMREAGTLPAHDRRLADIEWCLGLCNIQMGRGEATISHYRQAAATFRLRRASLQRAALDRQIEVLAREAEAPAGGAGGDGGNDGSEGASEIAEIDELLVEIEARTREVQQAMQQPQ